MARKRMFDKGLIETDAFMDMSMPSKALYFLLGMEADDEGFVSPKRVIRLYGGNEDDLKILIAKGFVIQFDSGVMVITDWLENNYLDKKRVKETVYQNEKKLLLLSKNKYMLNNCLTNVEPVEKRGVEKSVEDMSDKSDVQVERFSPFDYFWQAYPKKELKKKSKEIWKRKGCDEVVGEILDFVERAKQTDRWKRGFVKQPTTFLNGECWNDDLLAYNEKSKTSIAFIS